MHGPAAGCQRGRCGCFGPWASLRPREPPARAARRREAGDASGALVATRGEGRGRQLQTSGRSRGHRGRRVRGMRVCTWRGTAMPRTLRTTSGQRATQAEPGYSGLQIGATRSACDQPDWEREDRSRRGCIARRRSPREVHTVGSEARTRVARARRRPAVATAVWRVPRARVNACVACAFGVCACGIYVICVRASSACEQLVCVRAQRS